MMAFAFTTGIIVVAFAAGAFFGREAEKRHLFGKPDDKAAV